MPCVHSEPLGSTPRPRDSVFGANGKVTDSGVKRCARDSGWPLLMELGLSMIWIIRILLEAGSEDYNKNTPDSHE